MRIYPAVHYTMGGLWVDYDLMSNVPASSCSARRTSPTTAPTASARARSCRAWPTATSSSRHDRDYLAGQLGSRPSGPTTRSFAQAET